MKERCFIDTHIFLFLFLEPEKLETKIDEILGDYNNQFILSVESVREILMLIKNGKINSRELRTYADIKNLAESRHMEIRYIHESHLKKLSALEPFPGHSDPADLMIIAQTITENLPIISSDSKFKHYAGQGLDLIYNNCSKR